MDRPEKEYAVNENATLDCNYGASYGRFLDNPEEDSGMWIDDYKAVTETHTLLSGFTFCALTKEHCTYQPLGTWEISLTGFFSEQKAILSTRACLRCKQGGIITIKECGQNEEEGYITFG